MNNIDLVTFFTVGTFAMALLLFVLYWILRGK